MRKSFLAIFFIIFFPFVAQAATGDDIWVIETGGESAFVSLLGSEYTVTTKTTDEIKAGIPDSVDLLIYPGGLLPILQAQDSTLQEAIRTYINGGGKYFGSCGGSIPGAESLTYDSGTMEMIGLVPVVANDYLEWTAVAYADGFIFNGNAINGDYGNGTHWLSYTGGPAFDIAIGHENEVEVLATFAADFNSGQTSHYQVQGKAAIVSANYGLGKVLLSAPHPESYAETQFLFFNMIDWLLAAPDYTPAQVTNVRVPTKYLKAKQVKIRWDTQNNMSGYVIKLYRKTKLLRTIKITANIGYRVIRKLNPATAYKVKVRAKRIVNEIIYRGPFSEKKSFTTLSQ